MPFACVRHSAFVVDRGGTIPIGPVGPLEEVKWGRTRDDVSTASVTIARPSRECIDTIEFARAGRHELVIYHGAQRVWEGPITHIEYNRDGVIISARDVVHYLYRTFLTQEYDSSYPNVEPVLTRVGRILDFELARMEAQVPPINVLPLVQYHTDPNDARTTSHTLPYQYTVFGHIDELAARGGLDYTAVGRAIHFFDVDTALGTTAVLTADDFDSSPIITEYGMELATISAVTDGEGNAGIAGEADPYYGLVEILDQAYDEDTAREGEEPPTVAEMQSQAQRILAGRNPTPLVARVPDNSSLNMRGTLTLADLVPGTFMPLQVELPGRSVSQMQKLDKMTVTESEKGEYVTVTLSPAPAGDDAP